MVFNGDADTMDLCGLADRMAKTDDTDFPLSDKALYANWGVREIFRAIMMVYAGWILDDSNGSGQPEATTNLLNDGTSFYAFATAQILRGMEFSNAAGQWTQLKPITLEQIQEMGYAETEFMKTAGVPVYYRPVKNGVKIYPSSSTAVTGGLKALIGRDITPFTAASTSVSPGYDIFAGHEAVASFMAMKYAQINTLDSFKGLFSDWLIALEGVKSHYKDKFKQLPQAIRKRKNIVDEYVS